MGALQTLRGRILAASLVLALLIGIAFVILILAVRDTRDAARVADSRNGSLRQRTCSSGCSSTSRAASAPT